MGLWFLLGFAFKGFHRFFFEFRVYIGSRIRV